ncbi:cytidine deaminase [Aeromicrobium sp.]|uniref:cytidine deaminase n=1 Tax=Aeromicrobium sp. TaxID=1871063 RepID=UPI0019AE90ED|nr:cytidine deaminase [Aeromicrobium sp.]MBC7632587.1 cytidine deaminase [Aeromicrobium sp.]
MELSPEDAKLVTLARASRARTGAEHGAAVRDRDGRTYAASTVDLPSVRIDALDLAVAMAVSSGASGLEAAALVTEMHPEPVINGTAVRDVSGHGVSVFIADPTGAVVKVRTT